MKTLANLASVSVLALIVAVPATAQTRITGVTDLRERIDDITDDVETDIARGDDSSRFGPNDVPQGWRGSFALTASGSNGNTDTGECRPPVA